MGGTKDGSAAADFVIWNMDRLLQNTNEWMDSFLGRENHFTDECVFAGLSRACLSRVCG